MRQVSYPPFIVFFDTLAVFLFLLAMNQNKPIKIEIPERELFKGAELFFKKGEKFYSATGGGTREYAKKGFGFFLDCGKQRECNQARNKYQTDKLYILLPEKVFNEISHITTQALSATDCKSVRYFITQQGELDYKKTSDKNKCLAKIHGFKDNSSGDF